MFVLCDSIVLNLHIFFNPPSLVSWLVPNSISIVNISNIWQGSEEKVDVTWVSWKTMCVEKHQGGLGLKDVGAFNEALMGK